MEGIITLLIEFIATMISQNPMIFFGIIAAIFVFYYIETIVKLIKIGMVLYILFEIAKVMLATGLLT